MKLNTIDMIALVLLVVGGINWGLVGVVNINLVDWIFGSWPMLVTLIYALVGLSALYIAWISMKLEKM